MGIEREGTLIESRYSLGSRLCSVARVETYFAVDTQSCEPVTAILFREVGPLAPDALQRFEETARRLALLSHPGLVEVLSWGVDGEDAYLITADAEGACLGPMITRGAMFAPERATMILIHALQALDAAHSKGFHHGRFGGDAIFFAADGRPVLSGIGVSQLLRAIDGTLDASMDDVCASADRDALAILSEQLSARTKVPLVKPSPLYTDLEGSDAEVTRVHARESRPTQRNYLTAAVAAAFTVLAVMVSALA